MNSPDFPELPTKLGEYTLNRLIGRRESTSLYYAKQSHVERGVVIEVLSAGGGHAAVESFLELARARVAVALPHVSQVFESMVSDEVWYLTQAMPDGRNIARIAREKNGLTVKQICHIVEAAAAMYRAAEERNVATGLLAVHDIYMRSDDHVNFLSPVLVGAYDPESYIAQQQALAAVLYPLLPQNGVPGQSRVATLAYWMSNGYETGFLTWEELAQTAAMLREQVEPRFLQNHRSGAAAQTRGAVVRQSKRNRRRTLKIIRYSGLAVLLAVAGAVAGALSTPNSGDPLPANDGSTILCREGMQEFEVAVRPVTIGEYKEFLQAYEGDKVLSRDDRRRLLADVPADGSTRRPLHWEGQWDAALAGKSFKGEVLSLDSPVRGVNYWDAFVYARYKRAQLPSGRLLHTARVKGGAEVSVCEWTTNTAPQNDIYRAGSIILPDKVGTPALLEPNRNERKMQYGFRIVYPR